MKLNSRTILIIVIISTLLLPPIVFWTTGAVRILFSLLVLLVFPGYTFLAALFPKRSAMSTIERITLSFGFSIVVISLLWLLLRYTPWGVGVYAILIAVVTIIVLLSAIGLYRDFRLSPVEKITYKFRNYFPKWSHSHSFDKALWIVLAFVFVVFIIVLVYAVFTPTKGETFAEFYILDKTGSTNSFPATIEYGDPVELTVGIINHENSPTSYRIEIQIDSSPISEVEIGYLTKGQKWQENVSFTSQKIGYAQKVELWLYKQGQDSPYNKNPLFFNIDVIDSTR